MNNPIKPVASAATAPNVALTYVPSKLRPFHIETAPCPDGYYVARFRYFDSPQPFTVIKQYARAGYDVRRISYDGDMAVCEVKYCEVAA